MSPPRAQRLKDTCDLCSASKVKCEKQRPICSRCDKLGYPCFYSPARRKGRPHPLKNQGIQRDSVEERERPSEQQRDVAEGGAMPSQTGVLRSVEPDDTGANAIPEQQLQHHREPHDTSYQHELPTSNAETCSSINRTDSIDTIFPHANATTSNLSTTNAGTAIDAWSIIPSDSDHSINSECSDCATVAMNVLQHLTTTSMQPLPLSFSTSTGSLSSPHHLESNSPLDLDTRLTTASTAIKSLSAILICPCSYKTDVGLLNATLCGAILELYDTILRSSADPSQSQSSSSHIANDMNLGTSESSIDSGVNGLRQVIIRRVVQELPKAANLVMQFAQRYSSPFDGGVGTVGVGLEDEEKEDGAADLLLPALAGSQKTRLRSIIHEATNRLTEV